MTELGIIMSRDYRAWLDAEDGLGSLGLGECPGLLRTA